MTKADLGRGSRQGRGSQQEARRDHRQHGLLLDCRRAPQRRQDRVARLRQLPRASSPIAAGPRNPKTGDHVDVPEKRIPYFKPGKDLKDLINMDSGSPDGSAVAHDSVGEGTGES